MIEALLPEYQAAFGSDPAVTILRTIAVGGHETAWMEMRGKILVDLSGQGREGQEFVARQAFCECEFKKGVGWDRDKAGKPFKWITPNCTFRSKVQQNRYALIFRY